MKILCTHNSHALLLEFDLRGGAAADQFNALLVVLSQHPDKTLDLLRKARALTPDPNQPGQYVLTEGSTIAHISIDRKAGELTILNLSWPDISMPQHLPASSSEIITNVSNELNKSLTKKEA